MTIVQATNILQAGAVTLVASFVFFYVLRVVRLDAYRQSLFALRDEFFDYAADGHITFESEAYQLLRLQMNSMIRFAHQLTLFRALMTWSVRLLVQPRPLEWNAKWNASLERIDNDSVRQQLQAFHARSMMIGMKHLLAGSPTLWTLMALSALGVITSGAFTGLRQLLRAASKRILLGPLDQQVIEEEAICFVA